MAEVEFTLIPEPDLPEDWDKITGPIWVVVALDANMDWVTGYIDRSVDACKCDLTCNNNPEDDNIGRNWVTKDTKPGVYKLTLSPWSHKDYWTGEFDAGLDVVEATPLWTYEEPTDEK